MQKINFHYTVCTRSAINHVTLESGYKFLRVWLMEVMSNNIAAYIKSSTSKPRTIIRTGNKCHFDVFKIISHWFEAVQVENLLHQKEGNGILNRGQLFVDNSV